MYYTTIVVSDWLNVTGVPVFYLIKLSSGEFGFASEAAVFTGSRMTCTLRLTNMGYGTLAVAAMFAHIERQEDEQVSEDWTALALKLAAEGRVKAAC